MDQKNKKSLEEIELDKIHATIAAKDEDGLDSGNSGSEYSSDAEEYEHCDCVDEDHIKAG